MMLQGDAPWKDSSNFNLQGLWGLSKWNVPQRSCKHPSGSFPGLFPCEIIDGSIACLYKTLVTSRACVRVRCIVEQNTSTRFVQQWAFAAFWNGESFWTSLRRLPPPILCWARCLEQTTTNTLLRLGAPVVVTIESLSCNRASILHPSSQRFVLRMLRFSTRNQVRLSKDQSKDFTSLFIYFLLCSPHMTCLVYTNSEFSWMNILTKKDSGRSSIHLHHLEIFTDYCS